MKRTIATAAVAASTMFGFAGTATAAAPEGEIINLDAPDTVPGLYIVGLHGDLSLATSAETAVSAEAESLAGRYSGEVGHIYSAALRGFSVEMSEKDAKRLAADPAVDFVQQSLWVHRADVTVQAPGEQPNPPSWGLDRIDGAKDGVYKYPGTGTGVTIYNTDSELNLDHTSFEGRARSGYDFVDEDDNVNDCKNQFDQGHGTHTGGTSSSETYGVAKDVTIVGVKVLGCNGSAPDADSIQGIDWVTQNATKPAVANASWTSGGAGADPEGINRAVTNSINSGVVWSIAGGNENQDACNVSPAKVPAAITVGATGSSDGRASYSNYGTCLDIFAPGDGITSASNSDDTGSKGMSGTSMAAPHVTGAAALYLSANPDATPQQVRDAIVAAAQDGVVSNPGSGSPNKFLDVSKLGGGEQPGNPVASFTADCSATEASCAFDASASSDPDGSVVSYGWDFGDGKSGSGVGPSHTYAEAGDYSVVLTVTDDDGKTDTVTKRVSVGGPPQTGEPPRASFTVFCQWAACDFDGSGSTDPDNDIASYAWVFGDGQTGTGVTASHTYPNRQTNYTATLTVTDRGGNTNSVSKQIQCWSFGSQAFCFSQ